MRFVSCNAAVKPSMDVLLMTAMIWAAVLWPSLMPMVSVLVPALKLAVSAPAEAAVSRILTMTPAAPLILKPLFAPDGLMMACPATNVMLAGRSASLILPKPVLEPDFTRA